MANLNIVLFSDYFRAFLRKIKFVFSVIFRWLILAFKFDKRIKVQTLEYGTKHIFENSYFVLRYKFKNVLYYHFKGIKRTVFSKPIIIDVSNYRHDYIVLELIGFFKKEVLVIPIQPEHRLQSTKFSVSISEKFKDFSIKQRFIPFRGKKIQIRQQSLKLKIPKSTELRLSKFQLNDYI
jgi:hypothetical protein